MKISILLILLISQVTWAKLITRQTHGKGTMETRLDHLSSLNMLNSFEFRFLSGADHHIRKISLLPKLHKNIYQIGYHDKNSDDYFDYKFVIEKRNWGSNIFKEREEGRCLRGRCVLPIVKPQNDSVFVLRGFELVYAYSDHHIDEIGVFERNSQLHVVLNDKNDDDDFWYKIDYAWIPSSMVTRIATVQGQHVRREQIKPIPRAPVVIKGFKFNFKSKDHHLNEIAVVAKPGNMLVRYQDKNGDDKFSWHVDYLNLK